MSAQLEKCQLWIDRAQELYPEVFPRKPLDKVPLAVGIYEQLCQHPELGYDPELVANALALWCMGRRYWASFLKMGAVRYNLDGTEQGPVTTKQRKWALHKLSRWIGGEFKI